MLINALEKLQNEAARIVTGLTRSVSIENLYRECGWPPLSALRYNQKLCFMYKAENGQVPSYISDIVPALVRETTQEIKMILLPHVVEQNYLEILAFHLLYQFGII